MIEKLLAYGDVQRVQRHMCQFRLVSYIDRPGGTMGLGTPGLSDADADDNDDDVLLTGADITSSRGVIARCKYFGTDRPDSSFAIKEGCREASFPTTCSMVIGGYLKNDSRCRTRSRK